MTGKTPFTKKIRRYWRLLCIFSRRSGYKRGEYLRKIRYFNEIGEHCYFQIYNFGTEPKLITFGSNVHIASGVVFATHDITAQMFRYMDNDPSYKIRKGEVKVGSNVFIGANSIVLYDVSIGDNVIIGAGSIVNRDIPSGSVAAGNPCRVIGSFDEYKKRVLGK